MNNEKQKDEIIALESIYDEEEFSYCFVNDQYEITLKIFINLPETYFFTYSEDNEVHKVQISHLPPLTLSVQLPKDYPSVSSPNFVLRSSLLNVNLMCKLCKKLDRLWKVNEGQEILFIWISFLQTETLQFLHIEELIDINFAYELYKTQLQKAQKKQETTNCVSNTSSAKEDCKKSELKFEMINENKSIKFQKRGRKQFSKKKYGKSNISRYINKKFVIDHLGYINPVKMLIEYNKMRNESEFKKKFYLCKICLTEKVGDSCMQFSPCMHVFCKECLTEYFKSKIKDGSTQNIKCPNDNGCSSEALNSQIKEIVPPELFLQYDTLLLNATLDTMSDVIYCPRKICQYPVIKEKNDELIATCPMCEYSFCILCKALYHGIEPCKINSADKLKLIKEYQEASTERKIELEKQYSKTLLQTYIENAMSENWIKKNSQNCPKCDTAIEKIYGCNKMTCWKCNIYFCWLCKTRLQNNHPYKHYSDLKSECYRRLFQGSFSGANDDDDDEEDLDDENDTDEEIEAYRYMDDDDYFNNFSDDEEELLHQLYQL